MDAESGQGQSDEAGKRMGSQAVQGSEGGKVGKGCKGRK